MSNTTALPGQVAALEVADISPDPASATMTPRGNLNQSDDKKNLISSGVPS